MFAQFGIEFFDFQLALLLLFVLGSGVKIAGPGCGFQLDQFSHNGPPRVSKAVCPEFKIDQAAEKSMEGFFPLS